MGFPEGNDMPTRQLLSVMTTTNLVKGQWLLVYLPILKIETHCFTP
jgi:hypothetical protein